MTFNSIGFLILFTVVFIACYTRAMKLPRRRNTLLLLASYVFYGMWDWRFLGLIIFTTLTTFLSGRCLTRRKSRFVAGLNIAVNLGILVVFKYFNFFGENLVHLFSLLGIGLDWVTVDILLPVGISFYTFQAIGYTVDAYRGQLKGLPTDNLLLFATFIAYFPQLVAGPIEHASNIIPQLMKPSVWNYGECVGGLRRVLWGLVKKVVVADQCGMLVDSLWEQGLSVPHGGLRMFVATLLFSVQIYCDFSGYCDIALGVSRMLGIRLMENFTRPYFSKSVLSFWHHWHRSLMDWFTQYLYIPLGGSRCGKTRHFLNIAVVFCLSGLWHGASWCFILWGGYWAVVYILAVALGVSAHKHDGPAESFSPVGIIGTLFFVVVGWAIFRSTGIDECVQLLVRSVLPCTAVAAVAATGLSLLLKTRLHSSGSYDCRPCRLCRLSVVQTGVVFAMVFRGLRCVCLCLRMDYARQCRQLQTVSAPGSQVPEVRSVYFPVSEHIDSSVVRR